MAAFHFCFDLAHFGLWPQDFRNDPVWIKARDASEAAGPILKISPPSSIYLKPVDFSKLQ